jgi:hypothetical protein
MTVATMEGGTLPMPPDLEVAITSQSGAAEPEFANNVSIGSGSRRCRFSASDVGGLV